MRALPDVVAALNDEVTRLTGKKSSEAIKARSVTQRPSSTVPGRPVGLNEHLLPFSALVRYLYQPGELEGGCRRATDPVWSLTIHTVHNVVRQSGQPALYYLNDGPSRGFVREDCWLYLMALSYRQMGFSLVEKFLYCSRAEVIALLYRLLRSIFVSSGLRLVLFC